ncbi:NAD(P)/FAD-dependent oxidoreductase [Kutzneria sp. 744]|uniref:flavin-containing monooxygenase n=1 Tax=Kutzneria sp. (strain 744) TaxID=345341 RepID=UPI0004B8E73D|nr:NAD(P)-binding domain-containing protein [Kutzneria sp. 744]
MAEVCVIGAGSSGIAACQVLQARGIDFDCYEVGSEIGGNWRYLNDNGMSSAYRSLHINTSTRQMRYASFPMPAELPAYPDHFQIARYFDDFVDHFGLRDKIAFRTEVTSVVPEDGVYDVTIRERDGVERTLRYRSVIVANGHHWDPRVPEFPGEFAGERQHSHYYRTFEPYVGKRVVVLGIGNSACDIAVELSRVADKTFMAMRRSAHVLPKFLFGIPTDHLTTSPLARGPLWLQRLSLRAMLALTRGDVTRYGLPKPDHKVLAAHPTVSDDILTRVGHGDVTVKPNIARFDGDAVVFADGSREEVDAVIYCTGYRITFPFLADDLFNAADNEVALYHRVVPPGQPGLYFLGLVQPLGAIMPLAEAQAHWIADLIEGTAALPPPAEMNRGDPRYRERMRRRYVASKRHTIEVDFQEYLADLKRLHRMLPSSKLTGTGS